MRIVRTETRCVSTRNWRQTKFSRHTDWLSSAERDELEYWRDQRRRETWLTGRWIGKALILGESMKSASGLHRVEILSLDDKRRCVRPRVRTCAGAWPGSLSISHTEDIVMVVACPSREIRVGCDLHGDQPLGRSFIDLWFSPAEHCWLRDCGDRDSTNMIWTAKEAFYKALNRNEPFAPRRFEVRPRGNSWRCNYRGVEVEGACSIRRLRVNERNYFAASAQLRGDGGVGWDHCPDRNATHLDGTMVRS